MEYFESLGLKLKTERGNRVFPLSDKASDVTKALEGELSALGVTIMLNTIVNSIVTLDGKVNGVITDKGKFFSDSVIVCCGGISYPATGSTGDGYKLAKNLGHSVTDLRLALVGMELCGDKYKELQGLSLKNVTLKCVENDKTIYSEFGEMLFTHFGVSGPIVLSCSSVINRKTLSNLAIYIDLKPALDFETLDKRLIREFTTNNLKDVATVMRNLLPKSIIEVVLSQSGVKIDKKCAEITQAERKNIVLALKQLKFLVKKLRPVDEAIVTAGGVNVKEINPKTMESKIVSGLYFAGEVIDVDAFTGGFNLQLAFSMGYVAGINC
jgi:predicted Rossmann fold flavoprotein